MLALAGCNSNEYLGDSDKVSNGQLEIAFSAGSDAQTKAAGDDAAKLGNEFVVYGKKYSTAHLSGDDVNTTHTEFNGGKVFDNYTVHYSGGYWEYVSYQSADTENPVTQTVKYWDQAANHYDFQAYSLGNVASKATASLIGDSGYTIQGTGAQLAAVYIADKVSIAPQTTSKVQIRFRSLGAKVRVAFFETIPGYSVKDMKFYMAETGDPSATAAFYGTDAFASAGKYTVTYGSEGDDANKAHVVFDTDYDGKSVASVLTLGAYPGSAETGKEYKEAEAKYLGRTIQNATFDKSDKAYTSVLPNESGSLLKIKCDYTLVSIDGDGETINVKGAAAVVPAEYTKWKPNHAYTYYFKISDNTDGITGGGVAGLYPIMFEAVVADDELAGASTVTECITPSITTSQDGFDGKFVKGKDVEITVGNGSVTLTPGTNANLYTVTAQSGSVYEITESAVAYVLANGTESPAGVWKAADSKGKVMTVSRFNDILDGGTTAVASITAKGIYAFEYINGTVKTYKVFEVVD